MSTPVPVDHCHHPWTLQNCSGPCQRCADEAVGAHNERERIVREIQKTSDYWAEKYARNGSHIAAALSDMAAVCVRKVRGGS